MRQINCAVRAANKRWQGSMRRYFVVVFYAATYVFAMFWPWIAAAAPVSQDALREMIAGWLAAPHAAWRLPAGATIEEIMPLDEQGFLVQLKPRGLIIAAADDALEPVIAFAESGMLTPAQKHALLDVAKRDLAGRMHALTTARTVSRALASAKWRSLRSYASGRRNHLNAVSERRVPPLLTTAWGQKYAGSAYYYCYNYFTPNHYPCGCVATAIAQLMRYHRYPTRAVGARTFDVVVENDPNPYQTLTLLGGDGAGGVYRWDLMPAAPTTNTAEIERQSIGALCHDAGAAVNMRYGPLGSSADMSRAAWALQNVFYFQNAVMGWNNFEFIGIGLLGMLNANLDAVFPVLLTLDGDSGSHAVVCDGYGYDIGTMYHHLNMGWGNEYTVDNAWYALPQVDATLSFNNVDECLYNIFPAGRGEIISGRVTDSFGNPLYGAVVTATSSSGARYQVLANRLGIYALAGLSSATRYTVVPTLAGYSFSARVVETGASTDYAPTSGNQPCIDFVGVGAAAEPVVYPIMGDYFGSGVAALGFYDDYTNSWTLRRTNSETVCVTFGVQGCQPLLVDFDGDGLADPALRHAGSGLWGVKLSTADYALRLFSFGCSGTKAVAGDFDGDGKADPALYHPASGQWWALLSSTHYSTATASLGMCGGWPLAPDFDGDGRVDPTVVLNYNGGRWLVLLSKSGYQLVDVCLSSASFLPAAGDFDGDGKADPALYFPDQGVWRIFCSASDYAAEDVNFDWRRIN